MTSMTGSSPESAKRTCPFDSYETTERRPAFASSFGPPWGNFTGYQLRREDTADCVGWKQELNDPAAVGGRHSASDKTLYGWNHETTTFDQNDVFSGQTTGALHSNVWNDQTAIQGSYSTWNAFQGPDDTGYDVETHNQDVAFTDQSAETLSQGVWTYPSLTSNRMATQPQIWRGTSASGLAPDNDTSTTQNVNTCDPNVTPWHTAGPKKESTCLELSGNTLQTTDSRVDHAGLKATPTSPRVQTIELTELTPNGNNGNNVCFGTVSHLSTILISSA
jgi:hypothetical protein